MGAAQRFFRGEHNHGKSLILDIDELQGSTTNLTNPEREDARNTDSKCKYYRDSGVDNDLLYLNFIIHYSPDTHSINHNFTDKLKSTSHKAEVVTETNYRNSSHPNSVFFAYIKLYWLWGDNPGGFNETSSPLHVHDQYGQTAQAVEITHDMCD